MKLAEIQHRYPELQQYVGWSDIDRQRIARAADYIRPHIHQMVDDFYATLLQHGRAARVITGGLVQVERLKGTLRQWTEELLAGPYDDAYVARRARVGLRHVEIGLEQVYTNVALSRMRGWMTDVLLREWKGDTQERGATIGALNRLIDLDLAVIVAVYEGERTEREKAIVRIRLEGALQQEKDFSESLLSHAQAIVLVLDLAGGIVRFNPYLEQLAGFSPEEVRGHGWLEVFLAAEDRGRVLHDVIDRAVAGNGLSSDSTGHTTATLVARDGTRRTVRWSSTLLTDANHRAYAVLVIGHDVTDLLAAQEQVLQSARLATIGQVATGLAHEGRNALQRIQASAEMLELEVEDRPEALAYIRRIEQAQGHMHRLLDEVRGYAAPIKLDRTLCRVSYLWREAWDLLGPQRAGRDATLVEVNSDCDEELNVDHFRLVQVFRNILENSLAACDDPVRIEVVCDKLEVGGQSALHISLRDNGPGIAADARHKIFEPFFTTKPKGTGLGMAIAQRMVEAHGGTINIGVARPGAEIVVTLPLNGANHNDHPPPRLAAARR